MIDEPTVTAGEMCSLVSGDPTTLLPATPVHSPLPCCLEQTHDPTRPHSKPLPRRRTHPYSLLPAPRAEVTAGLDRSTGCGGDECRGRLGEEVGAALPPPHLPGFLCRSPEAVATPGLGADGRAAGKGDMRKWPRTVPALTLHGIRRGKGRGVGPHRTAHVWGQGSLAACAEPIRGTW